MPAKKGISQKRLDRMHRVIELRKAGWNFYKIGESLNISRSQAQKDYRDAIRESFRESLDELVYLEYNRLEDVQRIFATIMLSRNSEHSQRVDAARIVLACSERRSKLLGLDKAIKFEVNDTTYTPLMELAATILEDDGR